VAWVWLLSNACGVAAVPTWIGGGGCLTRGGRKGQAGRGGPEGLDPKAD
jgi:hypothetical protein